ncbi:MAG: AbrB/MazE/SpoVT family DNA-binding domain-containing protein [Pseudomonadota bacterium]
MNKPLKITKIGNSAGIILSKEVLAHLNAGVGDSLNVIRTSRGIEISMLDPEFGEQLDVAEEVMERRHKALMSLANEIMDQDRAILAALAKK